MHNFFRNCIETRYTTMSDAHLLCAFRRLRDSDQIPYITDVEYNQIMTRLQRNCGEHFGVTNYSVIGHITQLRLMRWIRRKPEIVKYLLYWRGIGRYIVYFAPEDSQEEHEKKLHSGRSEAAIAARVIAAAYWRHACTTDQQIQSVTKEVEQAEGFGINTQHIEHDGIVIASGDTDGELAALIVDKDDDTTI